MTNPVNQADLAAFQQQITDMQEQIKILNKRSEDLVAQQGGKYSCLVDATENSTALAIRYRKFNPLEQIVPPPLPSIKKATLGAGIALGVGIGCHLSLPSLFLCTIFGACSSEPIYQVISQTEGYLSEKVSNFKLNAFGQSERQVIQSEKNGSIRNEGKKRQPEVVEEALKILNISKENLKDAEFIQRKYEMVVSELELRMTQVPPFFAKQIENLIRDCHIAYQTLQGEKNGKSN